MTDATTPDLAIEIEDDFPLVEIEAPEPGSEPNEATKTEKATEAASEPSDGVEELRSRLAEEQKQRQAAETRARMSEEQAQKAQREVETGRATGIDAQIGQLSGALQALTAQGASLRRDYADAMRAGEFDKVAEIQEKISDTAARRMQIEQGKAYLEQQKKVAPRQAPVIPSSPVEALAGRLSPRSADWVRAHPEYASGSKYHRMVAADAEAREAGITADTDAYFAHVEEALGLRQAAEPPKPKTPTPVAAPTSRTAAAPADNSKKVVKLTAFDREMADAMGISHAKYAASKLATQKQA